MLVIRVELWPYGLEEATEILAEATIAKPGRDRAGHTYRAELRERGDPELEIEGREQIVEISGHDRRQSVWNLILEVLARPRLRNHQMEAALPTSNFVPKACRLSASGS